MGIVESRFGFGLVVCKVREKGLWKGEMGEGEGWRMGVLFAWGRGECLGNGVAV